MGRRLPNRAEADADNDSSNQSAAAIHGGGDNQHDLHIKKNSLNKRIKRKKKKGRNKENNKEVNGVFPRQKDGFTSLTILPPPGDGIIPGTEKDRPISLGHLIGRVKVGTSYLYGFREDKRNIVKAMYPISYNFYSSYGPTYDSTFSSLTLEETQLVQTCDKFSYPQGKQFTELIKNVCREDYSNTFVDRLLHILGGQDHDMSSNNSHEDMETDNHLDNHNHADGDNDAALIDFDSLKSLNEEGIDMSFIDGLKEEFEAKEAEQDESRTLEQRLDRTAILLNNLKASQTTRLNVCPNFNLNQVEQPSDYEVKLATKVLDNLTTILKSTQPGELVEVNSVRKAMGVNVSIKEDTKATSEDNTIKEDESSTVKSTDNVDVSDKKDAIDDCNKETLKENDEGETSCTIDATIKTVSATSDIASTNVVANPDQADINTDKADAKEPISQNKLDGDSEIKAIEDKEPVTATTTTLTDAEVINKADVGEESSNVVDMETDKMSVDHATGSICSSMTENEITVQN